MIILRILTSHHYHNVLLWKLFPAPSRRTVHEGFCYSTCRLCGYEGYILLYEFFVAFGHLSINTKANLYYLFKRVLLRKMRLCNPNVYQGEQAKIMVNLWSPFNIKGLERLMHKMLTPSVDFLSLIS